VNVFAKHVQGHYVISPRIERTDNDSNSTFSVALPLAISIIFHKRPYVQMRVSLKLNPLGKRNNAVYDNPHTCMVVQTSNKLVPTPWLSVRVQYYRTEDHKLTIFFISSNIMIFSSFWSDFIRILPSYCGLLLCDLL